MAIKRSLWSFVYLHIAFSILTGLFLAIGFGLYTANDASVSVQMVGLVLLCVFGSLFGFIQLGFAGFYAFGKKIYFELHDGIISLDKHGKMVSFPIEEVVAWEFAFNRVNYLRFETYDGHFYLVDNIQKPSLSQLSLLQNTIGCSSGERREVHREVNEGETYQLPRELGRWGFLFGVLLFIASAFLSWSMIGLFLGDPSSNLPPYSVLFSCLVGVAAFLWILVLSFLISLFSQRKIRVIISPSGIDFKDHHRSVHLRYSEMTSIRGDFNAFANAYVLSVPSLYLATGKKSYRIRWVRLSAKAQDVLKKYASTALMDFPSSIR